MHTVWKYKLTIESVQVLQIPKGFKPLCVQLQYGNPCLWVEVDPDADKIPVEVCTYGTGHHRVSTDPAHTYIGTYQVRGGNQIYHVYYFAR